jgi:hypothetical protein
MPVAFLLHLGAAVANRLDLFRGWAREGSNKKLLPVRGGLTPGTIVISDYGEVDWLLPR